MIALKDSNMLNKFFENFTFYSDTQKETDQERTGKRGKKVSIFFTERCWLIHVEEWKKLPFCLTPLVTTV